MRLPWRRRPDTRGPLVMAYRLLNYDRQGDYGDPSTKWDRVARVWTVLLGQPVTARQAALCMAALKLVRAADRVDLDDLADGAAYLEIAHRVTPPAD